MMKTKKKKQKKVKRKKRLTLMAVQEKLGLFAKKAGEDAEQQGHDYLKDKPLGLI
jgi:hypothetical protein